MSKFDKVEMDVTEHYRTERALLASDDGERDNAKWVPLSQIEITKEKGDQLTISLPEWLAKEKGWV